MSKDLSANGGDAKKLAAEDVSMMNALLQKAFDAGDMQYMSTVKDGTRTVHVFDSPVLRRPVRISTGCCSILDGYDVQIGGCTPCFVEKQSQNGRAVDKLMDVAVRAARKKQQDDLRAEFQTQRRGLWNLAAWLGINTKGTK